MYSVSVRDHMMIAHSFHGEVFGPAQRLHGATYVVDVEFRRPELDADGIVVDIGRATEVLHASPRRTELPEPGRRPGVQGTQHDDRVSRARRVRSDGRGDPAKAILAPRAQAIESVRVTLHESHVASAAFEGRSAARPSHAARSCFVVPGRLETRTGGYEYDRRMVAGLRSAAGRSTCGSSTAAFRIRRRGRANRRRACSRESPDDGASSSSTAWRWARCRTKSSAQRRGCGSSRSCTIRWRSRPGSMRRTAATLRGQRAARAGDRRRVVVTSHATVAALADYGVPAEKSRVVEPGTDPAPLARGSGGGDTVQLLCVATLIAAQGTRDAVSRAGGASRTGLALDLRRQPIATPSSSRGCATGVRQLGLDDRVTLEAKPTPPRSRVITTRADVFVLPTLYEGYGMAVAEALAHGLPVVSTTTGAIPEIVPRPRRACCAAGRRGRADRRARVGDRRSAVRRAPRRGRPPRAGQAADVADGGCEDGRHSRVASMGDFSAAWLAAA